MNSCLLYTLASVTWHPFFGGFPLLVFSLVRMSDCAVVSPEQGERTLGATATERDEALAVERIALDVAAADDDGTEARVRVPHSAETPAQCPDDDEGLEEDEGGNGTVHGARGGCCQTRAGAWCCSRRVLSSFAMFSVLAVIGLLTSSFGPALPIIVNQTNVFVSHTLLPRHTEAGSCSLGAGSLLQVACHCQLHVLWTLCWILHWVQFVSTI